MSRGGEWPSRYTEAVRKITERTLRVSGLSNVLDG